MSVDRIDLTWKMFELVGTLGTGAFGDVYKVKCLSSTCISENGTDRVVLEKKDIKRIKRRCDWHQTVLLLESHNLIKTRHF